MPEAAAAKKNTPAEWSANQATPSLFTCNASYLLSESLTLAPSEHDSKEQSFCLVLSLPASSSMASEEKGARGREPKQSCPYIKDFCIRVKPVLPSEPSGRNYITEGPDHGDIDKMTPEEICTYLDLRRGNIDKEKGKRKSKPEFNITKVLRASVGAELAKYLSKYGGSWRFKVELKTVMQGKYWTCKILVYMICLREDQWRMHSPHRAV